MGTRFLEHWSLKKSALLGRLVHQEECVTLLRNFINRKNASLVTLKFHHSCRLFWSFLHILETLNLKLHCCRGNYDLWEIMIFSSHSWNSEPKAPSLQMKFGSSFQVLEIFNLKLHHYRWNFDLFFMFLKLWAQNSHNILKLSTWSSIIAIEISIFSSYFWKFELEAPSLQVKF